MVTALEEGAGGEKQWWRFREDVAGMGGAKRKVYKGGKVRGRGQRGGCACAEQCWSQESSS